MFFKDHLISLADIIEAKFRGYDKIAINPADKGELCEILMKEFLIDSFGDCYKVFRGGRIINNLGHESKQIDILLTDKRTVKIFGDKGIYPTETVKGCFSITSTLTKEKLISCCEEFLSIPKIGYNFKSHGFISKNFIEDSITIWKHLLPYKVIFAFKGDIKEGWIKDVTELVKDATDPFNAAPDLIIVNKVGFIEKKFTRENKAEFGFFKFDETHSYGYPFGKILYHLNTFNREEMILEPEFNNYFNQSV